MYLVTKQKIEDLQHCVFDSNLEYFRFESIEQDKYSDSELALKITSSYVNCLKLLEEEESKANKLLEFINEKDEALERLTRKIERLENQLIECENSYNLLKKKSV
jgi:hypothetical protein